MRTVATMTGRASLAAAQAEGDAWAESDLATVRDGLKRGATLVEMAGAVGRSPEAIALKIEELAAGQNDPAERPGEVHPPTGGDSEE